MSRSYKKNPFVGDTKRNKSTANRVVRTRLKRDYDFTIKSSTYKKLFDQYEICDYWSYCPFSVYKSKFVYVADSDLYYYYWDYRLNPSNAKGYTLEELYNDWFKRCMRK